MAITVADLLEVPHLRLRLHSGTSGLDREISWVHTSDLPEPWRWLAGGELLLTNGMSFPDDSDGQCVLLQHLIETGASGLAIGEQMYCPPLSDEFAEESERLGFSVLIVAYPFPFVAISQAVAAANLLEQSDRLIRTERIYHAMQRMVVHRGDSSTLSRDLSGQLGCEVQVCHRATAQPWYPRDAPFDSALADALRQAAPGASDLRAGAFTIALRDGRQLRLVDIPTQPSAVLVLVSDARHMPDAILMQHAATVLALELSQSLVNIEQNRRLGAELLAQLMQGQIDAPGGARQLDALGLDVSQARFIAITSEDIEKLRELHISLWRNDVRHLVVHRQGLLYVLCTGGERTSSVIRADLGGEALMGISAVIATAERIPEAAREASWAARAAAGVTPRTFRYGEATPLLGVAGIDDANALVLRVLGRLIEHERQHQSGLMHTLAAFLDNQRSWRKTADALHVHRQTVLYRIRKVEEITGHNVNDTRDIAELWLALQARSLLDET
ncbi:PucR family transcriptional regulator [Sciscionella marina]|uniref:PucR family transcriptional regulator n=1 Tax=Sciscionella marina TaxID=508770 RepID=UPI0004766E6E|nr:PucR family transcriptional regulator [Sciscionella marina]